MEREHKARFKAILERIAAKIPGIASIDTHVTEDKRVLLRFNDGAFGDPFFAQQMSDGTLKVFAYLLLLEDPDPPPFICIEEPENGLYHKLLEALAQEFRLHATGKKNAPQIFVTTHQPYFVDALAPEEVWILEKGTGWLFDRTSRLRVDRREKPRRRRLAARRPLVQRLSRCEVSMHIWATRRLCWLPIHAPGGMYSTSMFRTAPAIRGSYSPTQCIRAGRRRSGKPAGHCRGR
jgi:hypothetical protein